MATWSMQRCPSLVGGRDDAARRRGGPTTAALPCNPIGALWPVSWACPGSTQARAMPEGSAEAAFTPAS
eukprot:9128020-Alexandrium_andersonii.AAC.1